MSRSEAEECFLRQVEWLTKVDFVEHNRKNLLSREINLKQMMSDNLPATWDFRDTYKYVGSPWGGGLVSQIIQACLLERFSTRTEALNYMRSELNQTRKTTLWNWVYILERLPPRYAAGEGYDPIAFVAPVVPRTPYPYKQNLYMFVNEVGNIKLGISDDPIKRAKAISYTSGMNIECVAIWKIDDKPSSVESQLLAKYKQLKKLGEWFHPKSFTADDIELSIRCDFIRMM
ncbi:GIY-YIG nuclease family protein (plasmid) [Pseudomonas silesiensis]|uniref:GIY-YIG nuclease family protein n=1 Tax=Pseudomonas silesiensis TaxID=1853130 RepID=UPI0030D357EA